MAERTICPACGAPLDYRQTGDVVRCDFCGADVRVEEGDGAVRAQVVLHPPQEDLTEAGQAALRETIDERIDAADQLYNPPLESTPDPFALPGQPGGGAAVFTLPETPPVSEPPLRGDVLNADGTPVIPAARAGSPARWIIIAVVVLAALCLMCACLGALVYFNINTFNG